MQIRKPLKFRFRITRWRFVFHKGFLEKVIMEALRWEADWNYYKRECKI